MQLYAFDCQRRLTFAANAKKEINYSCMECGAPLRLRGGFHRQKHFFHLQRKSACRLNGKSMPHILVQKAIQDAFPQGAVALEKQFPEIFRIADAVHEELKIIFEIQCSPISSEEVQKRNQDYGTLGYQVLWIFHDQQFNQKKVSEAEYFLRGAHYFTNMDKEGQGEIYDQYSVVKGAIRKRRLQKLPLNIAEVCPSKGGGPGREEWQIRVKGDHWDKVREDDKYAALMVKRKLGWWSGVKRWYWIVFGMMLERAAR